MLNRRSYHPLVALLLPALACGDDARPADTEPTATVTMTAVTLATATDGPATDTAAPTTGGTPGTADGTDGLTDGLTGTAPTSTPDTASSDPSSTTGAPATDSADATTMGVSDSDPPGTSSGAMSTGDAPCPDGTILCDGDTKQVCDGMGGIKDEEVCAGACVPDVGCTLCFPGATECMGDTVVQCNQAGDGQLPIDTCDPLQGLACDADLGACAGACAGLGPSYIGCDYYPQSLQNFEGYNNGQYQYAVAVSNTSGQVASVTVTRGGNMVAQAQVQPSSVQIIVLPWVPELAAGFGGSTVVVDGSYRLRSDQPVTVYQYNPLTVTVTNDASVLLPVNTWTGNYLVAAWPTWIFANMPLPGLYTVTARQDDTTVTLHPSATGKIIKPGGGVAADGSGVVVLGEGDVLAVYSNTNGDVTGTIVEADKPVQVLGGHKCTNVPLNVTACDHLEESMFPIETLAKEYVVAPPVQFPNNNAEKGQIVRVIASEPATTLTFAPDQPGNKFLANAGDFVELPTSTAKYVVSADKKILVSQYMVGQDGGYGASDPAMLLAVNPLQWRKNYLFHAPLNWQANFVDILAPMGAAVTVDGNPVGNWAPIGGSNYQLAHIPLPNNGTGNHSVTGDVGVGIGVYGVLNYGSYWYPGGLDLDTIPQ
mgnify:CR=1 FL=1